MTQNLATARITGVQLSTILVCFLMNMFDGMDVTVISYTAPSIAKEWSVSPEALGLVFSSGLFGMTLGALLLAPWADTIGRRSLIVVSAILMGGSVFLTGYVQTLQVLAVFRFIAGLGIGAMLVSTSALTAEYAPAKTRDFWVSFVVSGYPIGAVLSGLAAVQIIPLYGWRMQYHVIGLITIITMPLVFIFLSESLDFLLKKQPANALQKANAILKKMKQDAMEHLPELNRMGSRKASVKDLMTREKRPATLRLWIAAFMSFATLFFLTNWIPKLAASTGLSLELAIYSGTVFNLGAFAGIVIQGYLSSKYGLRRVLAGFFFATAVLMFIFGFFKGSVLVLILFGLIGFGIQGGFVGLYAVAARLYPTEYRSTGIGWAMGAGRTGAIIGPMLGGVLIGMGLSMALNFTIFAVPAIIAGIAMLAISSAELK